MNGFLVGIISGRVFDEKLIGRPLIIEYDKVANVIIIDEKKAIVHFAANPKLCVEVIDWEVQPTLIKAFERITEMLTREKNEKDLH